MVRLTATHQSVHQVLDIEGRTPNRRVIAAQKAGVLEVPGNVQAHDHVAAVKDMLRILHEREIDFRVSQP